MENSEQFVGHCENELNPENKSFILIIQRED